MNDGSLSSRLEYTEAQPVSGKQCARWQGDLPQTRVSKSNESTTVIGASRNIANQLS